MEAAVDAYGGDLMPGTSSPALAELGDYVAVAVREALLANPKPGAVLRYSSLAPYDTEVVEVALAGPAPAASRRGRCSRAGSRLRATDRSGSRVGPETPAG